MKIYKSNAIADYLLKVTYDENEFYTLVEELEKGNLFEDPSGDTYRDSNGMVVHDIYRTPYVYDFGKYIYYLEK